MTSNSLEDRPATTSLRYSWRRKAFPCKSRLTMLESIVTTSPTNICQHGNDFHHLSAQKLFASLMLWETGWLATLCESKLPTWILSEYFANPKHLPSWSFKTVRYFGVRLDQVKKTGIVVLRPREVADDSCSESESDEE